MKLTIPEIYAVINGFRKENADVSYQNQTITVVDSYLGQLTIDTAVQSNQSTMNVFLGNLDEPSMQYSNFEELRQFLELMIDTKHHNLKNKAIYEYNKANDPNFDEDLPF